MHFEQYGKIDNPQVVLLHGAFFVHSFGRQYPLSDKYCLLVPHLPGFGKAVSQTFTTEGAIAQLTDFIKGLERPVTLVGFSVGAQLAVKLLCQQEQFFNGGVIVSPWLLKDQPSLDKAYQENAKQLKTMKNRFMCHLIGMMNGLPGPQRKEFVEQMQQVSEETLKNVVYNDITLESVSEFADLKIPTIALAGGKEQSEVKESVLKLSQLSENCRAEIWPKAAHNIPPLFHKRFNALLRTFLDSVTQNYI